jgi:hypothetical protein
MGDAGGMPNGHGFHEEEPSTQIALVLKVCKERAR